MHVKFILPALTEATNPYWRPIKYSLFPPLGLATLAAFVPAEWEVSLQDEHVEELYLDDTPDLVLIQVYITNAYRAYALADLYRARGSYVCLGGLHVTSLPAEAAPHADSIFLGPGEDTFPEFLSDWRRGQARPCYIAPPRRTLVGMPPIRRDLIRRELYLVPNSIVVTRGCPHHCDFCYKDAFFEGGTTFYTQPVEDALAEIDRLPGRHLYFLDDHLLGHQRFAGALFDGMQGMNRLFQGAATVDSILRDNGLLEKAAAAGLRSLFVGFETLSTVNLRASNKRQNLGRDYARAIARLHDLGIMINGSFVFGLDDDGPDVFPRTVEWAVSHGITTATFHIATPYPGTEYYKRIEAEGRLLHRRWNEYDTRTVVHRPGPGLTAAQLKQGYDWAYREFYSWANITKASLTHQTIRHQLKHFAYAGGWKRFEPLWNFMIKTRHLHSMRPLLEAILSKVQGVRSVAHPAPADFIPLPVLP
ncbi:cobalamin-dependent protein [Hymenobacter sp. HSC-4F20]|uniref:B12-binding domain-containing radical SAM protein n=1 Tax=Hymenobacter sp. HSC-4F20 TaxID=2864135 RepID=UPI001C72A6E7|nr:cobalamin-dependent protein [Hymenobacter sp. HSC-4F20]MBX0292803.1 cobalamin-dependent protein [Hymenobacter sp. HSC-4F20]